MSASSSKSWHLSAWPPLAWLETAIKLVALAIGISAGIAALSEGGYALPGGVTLVQWIVLIVLALGLVAAIGDRWIEREIVAMIFVILNNAGHWGMVLAVAGAADVSRRLVLFAALMLAGDLVKLVFLALHTDFTVRDVPRRVLYGLTATYVVGYALILLLALAD